MYIHIYIYIYTCSARWAPGGRPPVGPPPPGEHEASAESHRIKNRTVNNVQ